MLVALAILAVPVPAALGQAQRPKPQELWRQFPLESARSNAQAPERRSAPRAPPQRSRSAAEEDREGSLTTFQIVAIALTLWLLATLMIYGLLRALRTARRRFVRARAATVRKRTVELRALREGTIAAAATEGSAPALSALEEAPDHPATRRGQSTADDELDRLKAKLVLHRASPSSPADHELQILKAKRGQPAARVEVERPAEVETLKAKLAGNGAPGAPPKTRRKTAAGVASKQRRK